jgi:DNA/RNA-binding domain of Phe-tRNA-synthetase-like protein
MIYRVEESLFQQFPDFCRAVVVASKVDNRTPSCEPLYQLLLDRALEIEHDESITPDHPRIRAWTEAYRKLMPKDKHRPSIDALVRRIRKGRAREIPFISPLVCISNLISLRYLTPSGLIDAGRIQGDLVLGYADGTEAFEAIGNDHPTTPDPGEVIYYDSGSKVVMCRAWNSRGGKATFILPSTSTAVLDVDSLAAVLPREELEAAAKAAADLVGRYCGGATTVYFLSKENPSFRVGA